MDSTTKPEILTDDEVGRLVLALAHASPVGFTEEGARDVLDWAVRVRMDALMLESVLAGDFTARLDPESGEMTFGITPQGRAKVEAMGND